MAANETATLAQLVTDNEKQIVPEWIGLQKHAGALQTGRITEGELTSQSTEFLQLFRNGLAKGGTDLANPAYTPAREFLATVSRSRALQGFSPIETATFIFSLKQPLFDAINRVKTLAAADVAKIIWTTTTLLDELGLFTFDTYQKSREEVILRQQREISELSTPVVKLWEGVLALPVIGTLDSERTQVIMETCCSTLSMKARR